MSSREEFEAWLSSEYPWGNEALDKAFFSGNDDNGYYTGGDFIYDGSSCADALFWAWRGWQESHKQGKAKCAALAAENAGLKQFPEQIIGFIGKLGTSEMGSSTRETIESAAKRIKTPATDAFLAEVRAISLEDFADVMAGSGNYDAANHATKHAHKIRKEAAQ